ncbi:hypothetical protein ACLOJK_034620 [Asimina triloba]
MNSTHVTLSLRCRSSLLIGGFLLARPVKPRPLPNPRPSLAPLFSICHLRRQTLPSLDLAGSVRFVSQNYMGDRQRRGAGTPDLFSGQTKIKCYNRLDLVTVAESVS